MMSSRGMFIAEGCKKRSQCQQWQESSLALTSFNDCYGTTGGGCHHEFVNEKKGGFEVCHGLAMHPRFMPCISPSDALQKAVMRQAAST